MAEMNPIPKQCVLNAFKIVPGILVRGDYFFIFFLYLCIACISMCACLCIHVYFSPTFLRVLCSTKTKNAVNDTKSPATRCKHSNDRLMRLTYIDFFPLLYYFFSFAANQKSVNPVTFSNKTQILLPGKTCLFV